MIKQNLQIFGEKMVMSAEFKGGSLDLYIFLIFDKV